jgi:hypothetical protein
VLGVRLFGFLNPGEQGRQWEKSIKKISKAVKLQQ